MEAERNSKGQFVKTNGRPRGAKNKLQNTLQEKVADFLNGNFDQIQKDFKALRPSQRIKLYIDMLKYALPVKRETDLSVDLGRLPDDQIDEIVEQILSRDE